ncbi:hypothetical protein ACFL5V_12470 [Fibrobacterota bacterium]
MNDKLSSIRIRPRIFAIIRALKSALALAFTSCLLHGPWEYAPEEEVIYRGLWVTGYVIAGQPVRDICFEKLHELDEEYTDAFSFYISAEVTISGVFGSSSQTISLTADPDRVNCFIDPQGSLPRAGEDYVLDARVVWDSAAGQVETHIAATAHVPEYFQVRDTARAPAMALTGQAAGAVQDSSGTDLMGFVSLFESLPEEAQDEFNIMYGDTLEALFASGDTAALTEFFTAEIPAIMGLLNKYTVEYQNGDSIYFLTGDFFLLSHLFGSYRSDDVAGVQITQRYDEAFAAYGTGMGPFLGIFEPDTGDYYFSGSIRHLMVFPRASGETFNLLDSMAILNPMFLGGKNMFYFYGFEEAYVDFHQTEIEYQQDVRIRGEYNIRGAAGIFAGAVVDSFEIYVKADPFTEVYPREVTKVAHCKEERGFHGGDSRWEADLECRAFYSEYCENVLWKDADCVIDLYSTSLELNLSMDALLDSLRPLDSLNMLASLLALDSADSAAVYDSLAALGGLDSAERESFLDSLLTQDTLRARDSLDARGISDSLGIAAEVFENSREEGWMRFCVQNNYPDSVSVCETVRDDCATDYGITECKRYLWQFCLDEKWVPEQCGLGLVSYCTDRPRRSELLCGHADEYCLENPDERLCR